ncbi:hypothetical protein [Paraburkholderia sp. RAU2J]|uniref:hypothetical protein n=1 Tax=Paraburkholderia sp. RAU2J TaxID=1938810 RepID=UPI00131594C6|nr:hypothetical protein [Paraburkholderia sp. RAU2J]
MSRHSVLSPGERDSLFAVPDSHDDLIRHSTFSEPDVSLIRQHRSAETVWDLPHCSAACAIPE